MTDFNPMSPPLWLNPATAFHEENFPVTRFFICKTCEVRWKDQGYVSRCWLCEEEVIILTKG